MRRLFRVLSLAGAAWCAAACERTEPGAGSSTNWLRPCQADADCADGLSCLCGACTQSCATDCSGLTDAVCAEAGSARLRAQCGAAEAGDLCLPRCRAPSDCAPGQLCVDGACIELAPPSSEENGCSEDASLELTSGVESLQARYGTWFSGALYLPVAYAERPADWSEPAPPAALTARVTDSNGAPLEGCRVRFLTGQGSGVAFPDAEATNASGELVAYWIAGDAGRQSLSAAVAREDGTVTIRELEGVAYANDEGPQSEAAERAEATQPATLRLYYDLPAAASRFRVGVTPHTLPHHAFYSAIALTGFFTGLQNTSSVDAATGDVPDADRALIASVWNLAEGDAQQLFGVPELECAPHDQELGGIRCMLPSAWSLGQSYELEVERLTLAEGESVPDYEEIGYATEACASAAGCTDYSLFFGGRRILAYRYQTAEAATSFSSFVQAYQDLPEQTSCLATPSYDVTFTPTVLLDGAFAVVRQADFVADYASWQNQVCANYLASAHADGYRLRTGGPTPLERPLLPEEPARLLVRP